MRPFAVKSKPPEAHLRLLATMFLVFQKCRREGLMSIESDLVRPRESKLFTAVADFDTNNAVIYTVLCDALRLMVGGNLNAQWMARYLTSARETSDLSRKQASLFNAMETSVLATLDGYCPSVAIEFGRQCIPASLKPDFDELEAYLQGLRGRSDSAPTWEETDAILVNFFDGINK